MMSSLDFIIGSHSWIYIGPLHQTFKLPGSMGNKNSAGFSVVSSYLSILFFLLEILFLIFVLDLGNFKDLCEIGH